MKLRRLRAAHLFLPVCWMAAAAFWSFPVWRYSHRAFTLAGGEVLDWAWNMGCEPAYRFAFAASGVEMIVIAAGLVVLRTPLWIYWFAVLGPVYALLNARGHTLEECLEKLALCSTLSLYVTGFAGLVACFIFKVIGWMRRPDAMKG